VAFSTLKKRVEFLWVRDGRRWSTPSCVLEARSRADRPNGKPVAGEARFGFTVTKKIGGAVVRNRVRRRLRALTAGLDPTQVQPCFDYVLIARSGAISRTFPDLKADLQQALMRVHQPQTNRPRGRKTA
jgi:ribonuclease P protein component